MDPVGIHRRIGYLPGEFALYDKLTGGQTIEYFANLRGGVDATYQKQLLQRLDLDPSRKFKEYSKGNKQKIGLIVALQHRPDLLILDEPTSGLDPLVQQTFYEVIREAKAEGRTIFLSSHILSEVEKTCDRVAIIREGQLVKVDRVEALRDLAHHQVELRFTGDPPIGAFTVLPGVSEVTADGNVLKMRVSGSITPVVREAANYDLLDFGQDVAGEEDRASLVLGLAHQGVERLLHERVETGRRLIEDQQLRPVLERDHEADLLLVALRVLLELA